MDEEVGDTFAVWTEVALARAVGNPDTVPTEAWLEVTVATRWTVRVFVIVKTGLDGDGVTSGAS